MADPFSVAIAAALVGKAAGAVASGGRTAIGRLYRLIKDKFAASSQDAKLLANTEERPDDESRVDRLAEALERTSAEDPAFAEQVRALWEEARSELRADHGGVVNQVTGNVSGNVIQARDIQGGITFGTPSPPKS